MTGSLVGTDPNWTFVGGDTGWALEQHGYASMQGRILHADEFRHDAPRPKVVDQPAVDPFAGTPYSGG